MAKMQIWLTRDLLSKHKSFGISPDVRLLSFSLHIENFPETIEHLLNHLILYEISQLEPQKNRDMWHYQPDREPFPAFDRLRTTAPGPGPQNPWGRQPLDPRFSGQWEQFMHGGALTGNLMDYWAPPQGGSQFNHPRIPYPRLNPHRHFWEKGCNGAFVRMGTARCLGGWRKVGECMWYCDLSIMHIRYWVEDKVCVTFYCGQIAELHLN